MFNGLTPDACGYTTVTGFSIVTWVKVVEIDHGMKKLCMVSIDIVLNCRSCMKSTNRYASDYRVQVEPPKLTNTNVCFNNSLV